MRYKIKIDIPVNLKDFIYLFFVQNKCKKYPATVRLTPQERGSSAPCCQICPLDLLIFIKLFLFFLPPHTSLRHHFVRWCSWFNKVVFLLCWRPLLSTLMWHNGSSDQCSKATGRVNHYWWGLIGMIKASVSLCDQIHQSNWKVGTFIVLNREQRCQNHGYIGKPAKKVQQFRMFCCLSWQTNDTAKQDRMDSPPRPQ